MDCVSCGLLIDPDEPWWGVYAWDAFEDRPLDAMALHEECYTAGEWIDASWWVTSPDPPYDATLVTERQQRLLRVDGAGFWMRVADPETGEPSMVPVPVGQARVMTGG